MFGDLFRQIRAEFGAAFRALRSPGVPRSLRFMGRAFVRWPITILSLALVGMTAAAVVSQVTTHFSQGTKEFGAAALHASPTAGLSPAPTSSPIGFPSPTPRKSPKPSPSQTPSSTPSPTASPTASGGGGGGGGGGFAWKSPKTGSYEYSVSGSENAKFGPLPVCNTTYASGLITITNQGDHYQADLQYVANNGNDQFHKERRFLTYSDAGVKDTFTEADVTCAGQERSRPATYDPALLLFKYPLAVGLSWTGHSDSDTRVTDYTSQVTAMETLHLAGRDIKTYVVKTHLDFTGDQQGSRDEQWWYAPSLGVPVKWTESTTASESGARFTQNATWTLSALP